MKLETKNLAGKSGNFYNHTFTWHKADLYELDPFFEVTIKQVGSERPIKIHRSTVDNSTDPSWMFSVNVADVGGVDGEFTITCYNWNKDGGHELIGIYTP